MIYVGQPEAADMLNNIENLEVKINLTEMNTTLGVKCCSNLMLNKFSHINDFVLLMLKNLKIKTAASSGLTTKFYF